MSKNALREGHTVEFTLQKALEQAILWWKKLNSACLWVWKLGLTGKGYEETSQGDDNVLYLDRGWVNTSVCIYQSSATEQ